MSDSEEDLQVIGSEKVQRQHAEETSEEEEESKAPVAAKPASKVQQPSSAFGMQ